MSAIKDLLLPVPGQRYESVPWGWVLGLVLIELVLAIVLGIIVSVMNVNVGASIGVVTAMSGGMMFAIYAEQRSFGVLTKPLKRQLALRSAAVVSILGTSATAPAFLGETSGMEPRTTSLIIAGVFAVTFLLNWLVHLVGLSQGQRVVAKQRAAVAAREAALVAGNAVSETKPD